jgi:hypothetical protein
MQLLNSAPLGFLTHIQRSQSCKDHACCPAKAVCNSSKNFGSAAATALLSIVSVQKDTLLIIFQSFHGSVHQFFI